MRVFSFVGRYLQFRFVFSQDVFQLGDLFLHLLRGLLNVENGSTQIGLGDDILEVGVIICEIAHDDFPGILSGAIGPAQNFSTVGYTIYLYQLVLQKLTQNSDNSTLGQTSLLIYDISGRHSFAGTPQDI